MVQRLDRAIVAAIGCFLIAGAATAEDPRLKTRLAATSVAEKSRTLAGLYLTAKEASSAIRRYPDLLLVDVRFPRVVAEGLPAPVTRNIPIYREVVHRKGEIDELVEQSLNPEFLSAVEALASGRRGKATTVLLICWAGPYSAVAADHLTRAGFANVYTVIDGTDGTDEPTLPGWRKSGQPWLEEPRPDQIWVAHD
ncbi:MAG TPA: hypothetical protein PK264_17230 [Hyphomicrobiaceae bacterium]|nr:hypothetical protein [Hyphomicrobiaceae bacterium]